MIELLVVIAILGILAALSLAALGRARNHALRATCINNNRNLIQTFVMFAGDHNDQLPRNIGPGFQTESIERPPDGNPPWAVNAVWSPQPGGEIFPSHHAFTPATLLDPTLSSFADYLKNPGVYKCPADKTRFRRFNLLVPSARSYSMSEFMGVNIGKYNPPYQRYYTHYLRLAHIDRPANRLVFLEEAPGTVNSSLFAILLEYAGQITAGATPADTLADVPSTVHLGAGVTAFADGHVEVKKWLDPLVRTNFLNSDGTSRFKRDYLTYWDPYQIHGTMLRVSKDSPDVSWIRERATTATGVLR